LIIIHQPWQQQLIQMVKDNDHHAGVTETSMLKLIFRKTTSEVVTAASALIMNECFRQRSHLGRDDHRISTMSLSARCPLQYGGKGVLQAVTVEASNAPLTGCVLFAAGHWTTFGTSP